MLFQSEDFSNIGFIGKIDGVWGLNRNAAVTRSHRRNRERGVGDGVEHSNDLTDRIVARRDRYLFTIGIRDHIGGIHIVEHDWVWPEEDIHGSDVGVPILVGVYLEKRAVGK